MGDRSLSCRLRDTLLVDTILYLTPFCFLLCNMSNRILVCTLWRRHQDELMRVAIIAHIATCLCKVLIFELYYTGPRPASWDRIYHLIDWMETCVPHASTISSLPPLVQPSALWNVEVLRLTADIFAIQDSVERIWSLMIDSSFRRIYNCCKLQYHWRLAGRRSLAAKFSFEPVPSD